MWRLVANPGGTPATDLDTITIGDTDYAIAGSGGGGGGGTDDQTAAEVTVDTTNFSQNLSSTDDSVQEALETIDSFSQYQGAWQQASWPAGVIVTRSGIAYISLVNSNTQIPTPSSTQWSGLPEGYTYRGDATVAAVNYNYGHIVRDPSTDNYYIYTSTISAEVTRADIPTHASFAPLARDLSRQDANLLQQIPRLGILTDDMRQKDVARVWEAPANSNHGMAVFTGLVTPTDAELEAATYATPITTAANTTTRILVVRVDLGDHPGDIRIRETGLPAGQVYTISGSSVLPVT